MCDCGQVVDLLTEIRDLLAPLVPPSTADADLIEVRGD